MATTYIGRTQGTPTNSKKWTISYWAKYNLTNGDWYPTFGCDYDIGDSYFGIGSGGQGRNEIGFLEYHTSATNYGQGYTTSSLRDPCAWYHIVFAYDSTQGTAADRGKTYINGVQQTNTYSTSIPSNHDSRFNMSGSGISIGRRLRGPQYMDGVLSHFHFVDGTAYDATPFGSTDSTTGEWKINTNPSVTYGNNGFFVLKDGNSLTDQSGNSNNFTLGNGTLTPTLDNPSNNFAVGNAVNLRYAGGVKRPDYSNMNLTYTGNDSSYGTPATSTLVMNKGKFYAEFKVQNFALGVIRMGVVPMATWDNQGWMYNIGYGYRSNGEKENNGQTSYGDSYTTGDIIGVAFDVDNGALWFSKNGTWQNSATISEIAAGTTTNAAYSSLTTAGINLDWAFVPTGLNGDVIQANYGNGYFGTTAVSSAGTNASNNGTFEYDVPTGFTALSTKGLNL